MRSQYLLIAMIASFHFGCGHGNFGLRGTLDDAVQRRASIDERILDWGASNTKETMSDGRVVYTWKFPWSEEQILTDMNAFPIQHVCTVVITSSSDNAVQSYTTDDCQ
jgi:hypothetical protein